MKNVFIDSEVFEGWWCIVADCDDKKIIIRSDQKDYMKYIKALVKNPLLIGYNLKGYDLKIINAIYNGYDAFEVHRLSKAIIEKNWEHPANNYKYWFRYHFIDLYDDMLRMSLKEIESNMGISIVESNIPFETTNLTEEQKLEIIDYCIHDVDALKPLFDQRKPYLKSKEILAKRYGISIENAYKATSAKIAAVILGGMGREIPQSNEYVIPESVRGYVEKWLPETVLEIFKTFDKLEKEDRTFDLFGNTVVFGVGGIHSTRANDIIVRDTPEKPLRTADVVSYYPFIAKKYNYISRNAAYPEKYTGMIDERVEVKHVDKELSDALKVVINATYGAVKNEFNKLYDPEMGSSICFLGQLLLASLAMEMSQVAEIIQTNTDGIMYRCDADKLPLVEQMIKNWEKTTQLDMECEDIYLFIQRDVNNYIEISSKVEVENPEKYGDIFNIKSKLYIKMNNGDIRKLKLKGRWGNQADDKNTNNLNAPITHTAIVKYYTKNIPIEDTINSCEEILDFCFTTKMGHTYDKVYQTMNSEHNAGIEDFSKVNKIKMQKVNRVVATTNKEYGTLYKYKVENDKPRYDKIAEIPENSFVINGIPEMISHLDKSWYIEFTKNKLKDLKEV